jgi:outer membrane usher protein
VRKRILVIATGVLHASLACAAPAPTERLLEVELNGRVQAEPVIVRDGPTTGLLLREADLTRWSVKFPEGVTPYDIAGERFIPVTDVPGLRAHLDAALQRLLVAAAPSLLPSTQIHLEKAHVPPTPSVPVKFIGYDLFVDHGRRTSGSGQLFTGISSGAWNFSGTWFGDFVDGVEGARLDTTIGRDWPERMTGLRLGDSITSPGSWGRAVRFGDVRWGTEFGSRPDLITFPLPAMRGEATVPSTVDVYVNGALLARRGVPAGEFSLHDLPVVSGSGELRLSVRDAYGRERSIEQPYFVAEELLRPGLSAFSVEVGFVREDYGIEDFAYGRAAAVGGYRRGLTRRLTGELRTELLEDSQVAGGALFASIGRTMLSGALAYSTASGEQGWLAEAGVDATRGRLTGGVRVRAASTEFRQLGSIGGDGEPRRAIDARLGWIVHRAAASAWCSRAANIARTRTHACFPRRTAYRSVSAASSRRS